jgi:hypothetical protein
MKKNDQITRNGAGQVRTLLGVFALVLALLVSACSPSTGAPAATSTLTTPTLTTPTPITAASLATDTSLPITQPTSLAPCELVNSQEASSLLNTAFGEGKPGSTGFGLNFCRYVEDTKILTVEVVQEQDAATAHSDQEKFISEMQSVWGSALLQLNITQLPDLADGGVMLDTGNGGSGSAVNGMGIGFVKGTVFFDFSAAATDGSPAPTSDAVQSEAQKVLGRLP